MARVVAYAIVDDSVEWTGRQMIFVGDEKLGRIPRLALGCDTTGELDDVLIFYCNEQWDVLALTGAATVEEAKAKTELAYRGLSSKWVDVDTPPDEVRAWIRENYEHIFCLFCGRNPVDMTSLITRKLGAICNHCIGEFYAEFRRPETKDGG
jgi:hypothetical protein